MGGGFPGGGSILSPEKVIRHSMAFALSGAHVGH